MEINFGKATPKQRAYGMTEVIKKPLVTRGKLTENKYCVIATVNI